jgi:hypothetical protein
MKKYIFKKCFLVEEIVKQEEKNNLKSIGDQNICIENSKNNLIQKNEIEKKPNGENLISNKIVDQNNINVQTNQENIKSTINNVLSNEGEITTCGFFFCNNCSFTSCGICNSIFNCCLSCKKLQCKNCSNKCKCGKVFTSFKNLQQHIRRKNKKIFSKKQEKIFSKENISKFLVLKCCKYNCCSKINYETVMQIRKEIGYFNEEKKNFLLKKLIETFEIKNSNENQIISKLGEKRFAFKIKNLNVCIKSFYKCYGLSYEKIKSLFFFYLFLFNFIILIFLLLFYL